MASDAQTWSERAGQAIGKLAARPGSLFLVLLAVNALARPYGGIIHDARLYSAQVLHQLDSQTLGDDLFFRYGSQDQFSIFSRFAAPLVDWLGLEPAFFLLYLLFNGLLIFGMKRLVEALVSDRVASSLALIFMMVMPLHFGGLKTLHVHEPFLTSRLCANAFVLFGLERTLRGHYTGALVLMALGMAFHPLMAVGGLLMWAGCLAWNKLPATLVLAAVGAAAIGCVILLTSPAFAARILGVMDEPWREVILRASPFNFVSEWSVEDWLNVGMGLIGVGTAAVLCWKRDAAQACFLAVAVVAGVAAVMGTALAESLPYALPLQGQPYRALWILKVLQVPLAFWFAAKLWKMPEWYGPLAAVILACFLSLTTDLTLEWFFFAFALAVLMLTRMCGLHFRDWYRRSLAITLLAGSLGWALYKLAILAAYRAELAWRLDTLDHVRLVITNIGPIAWLLTFAVVICYVDRRSRFALVCQGTALAATLLVQGGMALALASPSWRENHTRYGKDVRFVHDFLEGHGGADRPTIYSCLGRLDLVWLDLQSKCYFDWWQMGGVMYDRTMALEGQRRALVVGPFELERFREAGDVPELTRKQVSRFFAIDFDSAKPDLGHLQRLCQEDGIDFLLLTHEFPGLVTAGNGRVFLYDCGQVRAALAPRPPLSAFAQTQLSATIQSEEMSP